MVKTEYKKIPVSKKKRKRNVDSSDEDGDDDGNRFGNQRGRIQYDHKHISVVKDEDNHLKLLEGKYRDRAKERQQEVSNDFDSDNVEKFDVVASLSEQIFDDVIEAVESGDRQKLKSLSTYTGSLSEQASAVPRNAADAISWIASTQSTCKTQLGKSLLSFLKRRYAIHHDIHVPVTPAGRTIQQSEYIFSNILNVFPQDRNRSWERPLEQTYARSIHKEVNDSQSSDHVIPKASGCNLELLQKVMYSFKKRDAQRISNEVVKKTTSSNVGKLDDSERTKKLRINSNTVESNIDHTDNDSDEEDIFASVGVYDADYGVEDDQNDTNDQSSKIANSETKSRSSASIFGDDPKKEQCTSTTASNDTTMDESFRVRSSAYSAEYDDDDGIDLDLGGSIYDDDDDDDDLDKKNHGRGTATSKRKKKK